jgi:hypothetical protein
MYSIVSGRGGECANMTAMGVPYVQTRQIPTYEVSPSLAGVRRYQISNPPSPLGESLRHPVLRKELADKDKNVLSGESWSGM